MPIPGSIRYRFSFQEDVSEDAILFGKASLQKFQDEKCQQHYRGNSLSQNKQQDTMLCVLRFLNKCRSEETRCIMWQHHRPFWGSSLGGADCNQEGYGQRSYEKMKQSGCYSLFVGLESASNTILTKMNKGFTTDDALKFFNALHQANLFFGVSIMVGYPAETDEDFQNTLDFIVLHKDIIPQVAQINPFTYYDGTSADETADYRVNPIALKGWKFLFVKLKA